MFKFNMIFSLLSSMKTKIINLKHLAQSSMADGEPRGRGRGRGGPWGRGRGGMKRPMADAHEYEDFSDGYSKKRKIMDDVYRFLVREDLVRIVIGKGGANIRSIKEEAKESGIETKVSIYAQNSNGAPLMEGAVDRVMSVQSSEDGLSMALNNIVPAVQTHQQHNAGRGRGGGHGEQKRMKLELRLVVPAHCCSGIIGKGGSIIKKIKEDTNSYIQVYTLPLPNSDEHCVRIQNFEAEDLIATAVLVFQAIAEIKGKQPITMYDPIYFEHGEYGDTGSYIDTEWYQEALRSGIAKPTPYKQIRSAGPPAHEEAYGGGYQEGYDDYSSAGYGYDGAAGEEEYGYEESYYAAPAPRARGSRARGGPPRGGAYRGRGGAPWAGGRGSRGGAPMRPFAPRGGARGGYGRGGPRGRGGAASAYAAEEVAE